MGRILTVKALGISNLIYSMTIVDCDMKIISEAQRKLFLRLVNTMSNDENNLFDLS